MKISIVVPVFNLENEISAALDSIFAQTYPSIEVIAVDDGSMDGTARVLDLYAANEPRLSVLHQKNGGASSARMAGIKAASGDYIGFLDGDDRIDPDMFEILMRNACAEDADIAHCGYRLVNREEVTFFYNTGERSVQDGRQATKALLEGTKVEPSLCNKIFRAELFEQVLMNSTFDLSLRNNEDLLLNYLLFRRAKTVVFEDVCPYQYIVRSNSVSKGNLNIHQFADPVKAAQTIYADAKEDPLLQTAAERLLITKLIRAATCYKTATPAMVEMRRTMQKTLRSTVRHYLKNNEERFGRRALALFAALLPRTYDFVHQKYLGMQGSSLWT
ncbi:MAG: glycosyltransferase [Clostridia bacterium]|nr:glycosyltransferase [Clostridia bacterium]